MALSLNLLMRAMAGSTSAPLVETSAAVRTHLFAGIGTAGGNNVRTSRLREKSIKPVTSPWIEWWNGYVDGAVSNAVQEKASGNVVPIRAAFLTGTSGAGQDQSAATLTQITWFLAAAGTAGYAFKLDGSAGSGAEFTAASGAISGDGYTLTVPSGWYVRSDSAAGLALSGSYCIQFEVAPTTGQFYPTPPVMSGVTALGDLNKDAATTGTAVFQKNWTLLSGVAVGSVTSGPVNVYGLAASGTKTVGIAGDSIADNNFDRNGSAVYGDSDGAVSFIGRALNAGGYAFVRTAISGTQARVPLIYGGYAIRKLALRYCSAVITDMGHNDRGLTWAGSQQAQESLRDHWTKLRTGGLGGNARVIATQWFPQSSSTDLWATTANQTASMGAGTMGYDTYNPFIAAGSFNTSLGDPDAGYTAYVALYANAAANGLTDSVDAKWPTSGVAKSGNNDSTHPSQLTHTFMAAHLQTQLASLLGF